MFATLRIFLWFSPMQLTLITIYLIISVQAQEPANFNANQIGGQETKAATDYRYAVVVDCGSSGTRAHIYRWPADTPDLSIADRLEPQRDPRTGESLIKRIKPGLASLRDQPEAASDYMRPIMDFISQHVPTEAQSSTPVYFLGTAGLRLLTEDEQSKILEDIVRDLSREYKFPLLKTRVISGSQEGLYQWLSINAHSGRINPIYDMSNSLGKIFHCQAPRSRRLAMLEMGGASAQVTFELVPELDRIVKYSLKHHPNAWEAYDNSKLELNVSPVKQVKVFSTTFLGFGTTSARNAAIDLLVRDNMISWPEQNPPITLIEGRVLLIDDPCLPLGGYEVIERPLELLTDQTRNLGFVAKSGQASFSIRLSGTGKIKTCHLLLIRMVKLAKQERFNCNRERTFCSTSLIGTNFVPFNQFQFLGLAELFYTTDEMIHSSGRFNAAQVLRRTIEICSTPFRTLMQQYPEANRIDSKRVLLECFKATWMLTWLHVVIRMPFSHALDFETVDKINGNEVDWTLGALIGQMFEQPKK